MTGKRWKAFKLISMVLVLAAFVCAVAGEKANSFTMWMKLSLIAIVSGVYLFLFIRASKNLHSFVSEMETQLDLTERDSLYKFPAPAVIIDSSGIVIWYNKAFGEKVYTGDAFGVPISSIIDIDLSKTQNNIDTIVEYRSEQYRISAITTEKGHPSTCWKAAFLRKNSPEQFSLSVPGRLPFVVCSVTESICEQVCHRVGAVGVNEHSHTVGYRGNDAILPGFTGIRIKRAAVCLGVDSALPAARF